MDITPRIAALDTAAIAASLDSAGFARFPLLSAPECAALRALYGAPVFRSRIVMAHHNFGQGEYQYFADPLPPPVAALRTALYPPLAVVANGWARRLGGTADFPPTHEAFRTRCHVAGQTRPTPLLLRYRAGDYNCLHQDLYGDIHFPIQVAVLLSAPEADFSGGEFVLVEQRPRMQSRPEVVALRQGEAVAFAVNQRPATGKRGDYRVTLRHGVSRIHAGERMTLGIIFHDAR